VRIADCGLRIADCGFPDCGLRIADCGLRIADCGLRIADCGLRIADCKLRIADCGFGIRGFGITLGKDAVKVYNRLQLKTYGYFHRLHSWVCGVVPGALSGRGHLYCQSKIDRAMFEILETEKIVEGEADITLVPKGGPLLPGMLAAREHEAARTAVKS
jgi:hypothetical protein